MGEEEVVGATAEIDDARAAVVVAAVHEISVRGIEAATVGAIAARAGLHPAVVDAHFATREALLGAVLDRLAGDVAASFDVVGISALSGPALSRYGRVVARAILDGYDVSALQTAHPVMERLLPVAVGLSSLPEAEVKVLVARQMALQLGWLLFEPFVASSVGLTPEELTWARDGSEPFWGMLAGSDGPDPT